MRKIKAVDLVFENCEVARLDPTMFRGLGIYGITRGCCVNCCQYKNGEVEDLVSCADFRVTITPKGLDKSKLRPEFDKQRTLRSRIATGDITHVNLLFDNGKNEYIAVPWDESNQFTNAFETHEQAEDGLHIRIVRPERSTGNG